MNDTATPHPYTGWFKNLNGQPPLVVHQPGPTYWDSLEHRNKRYALCGEHDVRPIPLRVLRSELLRPCKLCGRVLKSREVKE